DRGKRSCPRTSRASSSRPASRCASKPRAAAAAGHPKSATQSGRRDRRGVARSRVDGASLMSAVPKFTFRHPVWADRPFQSRGTMDEAKSIFDEIDERKEARAIAEAEAEIDAGKGVPHKKVRQWLLKLA